MLDTTLPAAPAHSWTSPVTLTLATPEAIRYGLGLIGIAWNVSEFSPDGSTNTPGLYAWVDGGDDLRTGSPMERGALYFGVGENEHGFNSRLINESRWAADGEYIHGHALAMHRRSASAVAGTVELDSGIDLTWLDTQFTAMNPRIAPAKEWLLRGEHSLPKKAERIAIRLSMHLGDTVAPVNSQFAGAWESNTHAEILAYRISEKMKFGWSGSTESDP